MFRTAELDHVDTLHHYGRQLAVLKRIYQSYDQIIGRIMDMQDLIEKPALTTAASAQATNATASQVQPSQGSNLDAEDVSYGVRLSTAAIVRFKTLRDRIQLYALSEIQECLDEKEALVQVVSLTLLEKRRFTNFVMVELQSHQPEGIFGGGNSNSYNDTPSQGHYPLSARQPDDIDFRPSDPRSGEKLLG